MNLRQLYLANKVEGAWTVPIARLRVHHAAQRNSTIPSPRFVTLPAVRLSCYFRRVKALLALPFALLVLVACQPELVPEQFVPNGSHEAYLEGLARFDLQETELGLAWTSAAREAVNEPVVVELPHEELLIIDPAKPDALGLRFAVERGRTVTLTVEAEHGRYFADVFRIQTDSRLEPVAGRPGTPTPTSTTIELDVRRDGEYLLRLQPELLRGGRFVIRLAVNAALAFPVRGADSSDILSFYGDPRDGGLRLHEGVDIFAPRGTELLAASDATVIRVGVRDRGGNIVTLYDERRDLLLYYAHLEEQRVQQGDTVRSGDVIGTMGNTGNARTTPPHLHIGVYQGSWRNDVDPWPYFVDPARTEPLAAPRELPGDSWILLNDGTIGRTIAASADRLTMRTTRGELRSEALDAWSSLAAFEREIDASVYLADPLNGDLIALIERGTPLLLVETAYGEQFGIDREGRSGYVRRSEG